MEISWLGYSSFKIKGSRATVITDPFPPELGSPGKQTATIVTVSHNHPTHAYVAGIEGSPRVISGPGEYEIGGVFISGFPTYHDTQQGKVRGRNTVYAIEIDEVTVCHLGDLGHPLSSGQLADIGTIDILLLPVGGKTTIDAAAAAQLVRQMEPKIVVPMHYQIGKFGAELEPVDRFLKEMGVREVTPHPKIVHTKANLPPLGTQVVVLEPQAAG